MKECQYWVSQNKYSLPQSVFFEHMPTSQNDGTEWIRDCNTILDSCQRCLNVSCSEKPCSSEKKPRSA